MYSVVLFLLFLEVRLLVVGLYLFLLVDLSQKLLQMVSMLPTVAPPAMQPSVTNAPG